MNWREQLERLKRAVWPDPEALEILGASNRLETGLTRRRFLRGALIAASIAATVDVDQLLWTPGERTLLVPDLDTYTGLLTPDWVTKAALELLENKLALVGMFNREYDHYFGIGDRITFETVFDRARRTSYYSGQPMAIRVSA